MAGSEPTRARRFALPALEDERAGESIEAFLEGPNVRKHRPVAPRWRPDGPLGADDAPLEAYSSTDATPAQPDAAFRPDAHTTVATRPAPELRSMPGRLEWNAALERESLRAARYGRPAAVTIVEVVPDGDASSAADTDRALRGLSGAIARTLRHDSRATDLVARVATGRFQVLMPETDDAGAGRYAHRASAACRQAIESSGGGATVRVSVAVATRDHSLHEAVAHALRSLEAA